MCQTDKTRIYCIFAPKKWLYKAKIQCCTLNFSDCFYLQLYNYALLIVSPLQEIPIKHIEFCNDAVGKWEKYQGLWILLQGGVSLLWSQWERHTPNVRHLAHTALYLQAGEIQSSACEPNQELAFHSSDVCTQTLKLQKASLETLA